MTIKSFSKTLHDGRSGQPHSSVTSHLNYIQCQVSLCSPHSGYFSNLYNRAASGEGTPTSDEGGDNDGAALLAIFTPNQSTVS